MSWKERIDDYLQQSISFGEAAVSSMQQAQIASFNDKIALVAQSILQLFAHRVYMEAALNAQPDNLVAIIQDLNALFAEAQITLSNEQIVALAKMIRLVEIEKFINDNDLEFWRIFQSNFNLIEEYFDAATSTERKDEILNILRTNGVLQSEQGAAELSVLRNDYLETNKALVEAIYGYVDANSEDLIAGEQPRLRQEIATGFTGQAIDDLLTAYETAIRTAFVVTFQTDDYYVRLRDLYNNRDIVNSFDSSGTFGQPNHFIGINEATRTLRNYHYGAKWMGSWLDTEFNQLSGLNLFAAFRLVISPVVVSRVKLGRPAGSGSTSKGFTSDHTIYDIFVGYSQTMPPELFTHELGHVFINSAGFGAVEISPLDYDTSISYSGCSELYCAADKIMDSSTKMPLRTPADNAGEEGSQSNEFERRETVANLIQNAALERLDSGIPSALDTLLGGALVINVLRSTPPGEVETLIGAQQTAVESLPTESNLFITAEGTAQIVFPVLAGTSISILGKNRDAAPSRIFVGVERQAGLYDYGWLARDTTLIDNMLSTTLGTFSVVNGQLQYA